MDNASGLLRMAIDSILRARLNHSDVILIDSGSGDAAQTRTLVAIAMLLLTTLCTLFYILVIVAVWRLARRNSTFMLFFSHGISDILGLIQFIWLSIEVIVQYRVPISNNITTLLIRLSYFSMFFHVFAIAVNRGHSVFMPMYYECFWSQRITLFCVAFCWLLGLILDIYFVYLVGGSDRELYTHRIDTLSISSSTMYKTSDDMFPHQMIVAFYKTIVFSCIFIYACVVARLLWEKYFSLPKEMDKTIVARLRKQQDTRLMLFLLCFVCFVPNVIKMFNPVIELPRPVNCYVSTLTTVARSSISAFVLVGLSSSVRRNMPWPWCIFPPKTTAKPSTMTRGTTPSGSGGGR
ncbi:hypothetical protein Ddc_14926 [Ditylenchus destructor]|nr:hypothetical protein Ddc_14926 [Ditylenchus destructor]